MNIKLRFHPITAQNMFDALVLSRGFSEVYDPKQRVYENVTDDITIRVLTSIPRGTKVSAARGKGRVIVQFFQNGNMTKEVRHNRVLGCIRNVIRTIRKPS